MGWELAYVLGHSGLSGGPCIEITLVHIPEKVKHLVSRVLMLVADPPVIVS